MGKGKGKNCGEKQEQAAENKTEESKEQKKEDKNTEKSGNKDIILKAFIHCEGCSTKITNCLNCVQGVEQVLVDSTNNKVTVKGKFADPMKVLQRLQKKYGRNVELISPKPKPENKEKKEKETTKKDEPQVKVTVLKMYMHCEGCANDITTNILKMKGVVSVEPNMEDSRVTVRSIVDPNTLVEEIKKRLRKYVEIVKQEKGEGDKRKPNNKNGTKTPNDDIVMYNYPPQYSTHFIYPNQTFSDENVYACSIM